MISMLITSVVTALDYFINIPESFAEISNSTTTSLIDSVMLPTATHLEPPSLSSLFLSLPIFCFAYQGKISALFFFTKFRSSGFGKNLPPNREAKKVPAHQRRRFFNRFSLLQFRRHFRPALLWLIC